MAGHLCGGLLAAGHRTGRHTFLHHLFTRGTGGGGLFTSQVEIGNLLHPLDVRQIVGIWPGGDLRVLPTHIALTHWLVLLAMGLGALGAGCAWRRGTRGLTVYVVGVVAFAWPSVRGDRPG